MCNYYCLNKPSPATNSYEAVGAISKYWTVGRDIVIRFRPEVTTEEQRYIQRVIEENFAFVNLNFIFDIEKVHPQSQCRIGRVPGAGSWSYIGTDNLFIGQTEATMNLGWLDEAVILHEFGHFLGLKHEHQNPKGGIVWNEPVVIAALSGPPNNWDLRTIRHNVLSKPPADSINSTMFDVDSIMLYFFPKSWTKNGVATKRNLHLSSTDISFLTNIYHSLDMIPKIDPTELFPDKRSIARMREEEVVRLGNMIGAKVDKKWLKRKNVISVWSKLSSR